MDTTFEENQMSNEHKHDQVKEHDTKTYRYAGFWMRFWAFLLDSIIVFSINGILVYPLLRTFDLMNEQIWLLTIVGIFTTLISYLYFAIMTKMFSRTLGKQVFGLKVISQNESKLTWGSIVFREIIGRFIHHAFFICPVLYLVVAFSSKKEGIHDRFADTYVVHEE